MRKVHIRGRCTYEEGAHTRQQRGGRQHWDMMLSNEVTTTIIMRTGTSAVVQRASNAEVEMSTSRPSAAQKMASSDMNMSRLFTAKLRTPTCNVT